MDKLANAEFSRALFMVVWSSEYKFLGRKYICRASFGSRPASINSSLVLGMLTNTNNVKANTISTTARPMGDSYNISL